MVDDSNDTVAAARHRLTRRMVVHQAAGILMVRQDCAIDQAWRSLHETARSMGLTPDELAQEIVRSVAGGTPSP